MAYLVFMRRDGPAYDHDRSLEGQSGWSEHAAFMDGLVSEGFVLLGGPLSDERRVVLAVAAETEAEVTARLGQDPWSGTHLTIASIEPWTLRLNGCRG